MRKRGTDAIPLAPRPSLDQYRKQAKDLVRAARTGDPTDVRAWAADWIERLARLQELTATPEYVVKGSPTRLDWKHINREVDGIVEDAHRARLLGTDAEAKPRLTDAQRFLAWLHGFESWPKLVKHLEERERSGSRASQFESAADAVVTGDLAALRALVRKNPSLLRDRSARDHHATLLHYIAANGHEGFRQRTPKNAVEIARFLLESGAEPDALADMYDHRCTTMEMLVSSTHPHDAGVQSALVETIIDFGAAVDGVESNGSPIMTALRFGYPRAAETLVRRGARLDNVISAAAMSRDDLVDAFVADDGSIRPGVRLYDGPWPRLPKDSQVHLGYALTWGAAFGSIDVVRALLRKGVDPSGRDMDGPAIHAAAGRGRLDIVRLLLDHGASPESLNEYGGTVLGATLWYAHNAPQPGVDYRIVVRALIDAGSRTDAYPGLKESVDAVLASRAEPG